MTTKHSKPKTKRPVRAETPSAAAAAAHRESAGAADLTALREHPAFRAAINDARRSVTKGVEFSGEELDERLGITDEDKVAGDAWLDEYERQLRQLGSAEREKCESARAG
jgi:hypothetical protein